MPAEIPRLYLFSISISPKDLIVNIAEILPIRAIYLDAGFKNNDQLRTNAMGIIQSNGITDFKTVLTMVADDK